MKIYIVNFDAIPDGKQFRELSDKEVEKLYEEDSLNVDCFNSIEELQAHWNTEEIFYPSNSYMRVVK